MRRASVLLLAMLAGCASPTRHDAPAPAPIMHLVFVSLVDPTEASDLVDDCDHMLAAIPSVSSYFCGPHLDTGRANVLDDFDVAIGIGFVDADAYRLYVDDPRHVALLAKWKPRCASIRIHDVIDQPE